MKLSIKERIKIADLYPKEGNILTQSLVKGITKKVAISQEEQKEIGLEFIPTGGYKWNGDKVVEKEIEFSDVELGLLKDRVMDLDRRNAVTLEMLDLCLKIKNAEGVK